MFGVSMGLLCLFFPQLADVRTAWLTLHHSYVKGHFKSGNCQHRGWVSSTVQAQYREVVTDAASVRGGAQSKQVMELRHSS